MSQRPHTFILLLLRLPRPLPWALKKNRLWTGVVSPPGEHESVQTMSLLQPARLSRGRENTARSNASLRSQRGISTIKTKKKTYTHNSERRLNPLCRETQEARPRPSSCSLRAAAPPTADRTDNWPSIHFNQRAESALIRANPLRRASVRGRVQ